MKNLLPSVKAALKRARTLREGPIAVERALQLSGGRLRCAARTGLLTALLHH